MPRRPCTPYEKSEEKRAEEARELERRKLELFTRPCAYSVRQHCQLNPNNLVINKFYNNSRCGCPPFGDSEKNPQRQAWEACLWGVLRKQFMKYDRTAAKLIPIRLSRDKHMSGVVFGWLLEQFELYVNNTLDVSAALELFSAAEAEIDYKNCREYWLVHSDNFL